MTHTTTAARLSAQEVFDATARHMFTQGQQALHPTSRDTCVYRGRDGLRCAVGHWIPDAFYQPEMDENAMSVRRVLVVAKLEHLFQHADLLAGLQAVHDNANNWRSGQNMRVQLQILASRFNLSTENLNTMQFAREASKVAT